MNKVASTASDALSGKTLTSFYQRNIFLGKAPDIVINDDGGIDRSARDAWEEKCFADHPISYDDDSHPFPRAI